MTKGRVHTLDDALRDATARVKGLERERENLLYELSECKERRNEEWDLLSQRDSVLKEKLGLSGAAYGRWRDETVANRKRHVAEQQRIEGRIALLKPQLTEARAHVDDLKARVERRDIAVELGVPNDVFAIVTAQHELIKSLIDQGASLGRDGRVFVVAKAYLRDQADEDRRAWQLGKAVGDPAPIVRALTKLLDEFGDLAKTTQEEETVHQAKALLRDLKLKTRRLS